MLNRNDRKALRRNRSAVSWLCVLALVLGVWVRNLYSDISFIETEHYGITKELEETQKECEKRQNKIDSLINVINHKDTSVVDIKKTSKPVVRKDTTIHKADSIKPLRKDTILKDSIK